MVLIDNISQLMLTHISSILAQGGDAVDALAHPAVGVNVALLVKRNVVNAKEAWTGYPLLHQIGGFGAAVFE